jgi:hypothetical protein
MAGLSLDSSASNFLMPPATAVVAGGDAGMSAALFASPSFVAMRSEAGSSLKGRPWKRSHRAAPTGSCDALAE